LRRDGDGAVLSLPAPQESDRARALRRLSGFGWRLIAGGRDLAARAGLLPAAKFVIGFSSDRQRGARANALLSPILAGLPQRPGGWQAHQTLDTFSDVVIVTAGAPHGPHDALIKIAETPAAADGLRWQRSMLAALRDDERLGEWRALVPGVISFGETAGAAYLVETRLAGTSLDRTVARRTGAAHAALRHAADAICRLHAATVREATIDEELLDRWVNEPARLVASITSRWAPGSTGPARLVRLADELREALRNQRIALGWVHGDYAPGNVLAGPDGAVTGIIDWEFSHREDLPALDIVTLLLTSRMLERRQELGRVVNDLIARPFWTDGEAEIVAATCDPACVRAIDVRTFVLLYWLHHTANMIARQARAPDSRLWVHANVRAVLEALE
jgi:hypothetical protein